MKQNGPLLFQDFGFNNQQNVFSNGLNSNYVFSRNDQQAPPGPPPRWGGMLSKRPPTSCRGTRPVPCSPPSDDQGQQGFNYRPQPHTQVDSQLVVCASSTALHSREAPRTDPISLVSGPSFNSAGIGEHAATYMLITALAHSAP